MDELTQDVTVADSPSNPPQGQADSSPAVVETSDTQPSVTGSEAQADQVPDDPFKDIPDLETLKQQAEQKLPNAEALYRIRSAYEARKAETEPLMPWKDVVTQFTDPTEVITQRDLLAKIHSPVIDPQTQQTRVGEFTTTPFLNDLETQSPGTVGQLLLDALGFVVPDEKGVRDTLFRHLFRAQQLDPDRISDYRQIDLRAPAGVVTPDQLVGIDPKLHDAFKALSQAQREDILLQQVTKDEYGNPISPYYPAAVADYLQDKAEALEARQWRTQDEQRRTQDAQQQQKVAEQETVQAVNGDITTVRREMYDSIHKNLAEQWKPSTDEFVSKQEYSKVMGTLASLLVPEIRWTAEEALKTSGVNFDPKAFDELVNTFAGAREGYVRFTRQGDQMRAKQALSQANLAKAQLKTKLDGYALALAKPSAERLQTQSQTTVNQLTAAATRVVPSGSVQQAQGNGNPYDANPHQLGTPEYRVWNKNMDRQLGVSAAAGLTA